MKPSDPAVEYEWQRLRMSAVELRSEVLGADVRVEIAPRATVLVGRNGVGKSLLLEKLFSACWRTCLYVNSSKTDPARLSCEILYRDLVKLLYTCEWLPRPKAMPLPQTPDGVDNDEPAAAIVREVCQFAESNDALWRLDDGTLVRRDGSQDQIPAGRTLLNWTWARGRPFRFHELVYPLRYFFMSVLLVRAGVPRGWTKPLDARENVIIPYAAPAHLVKGSDEAPRLQRLIRQLVEWSDKDQGRFREFVEVARRTGIAREIAVHIFSEHAREPQDPIDSNALVSVSFDGTNIGHLSDGTLRVAEILAALIDPDLRVVLIEEPETAVHPGLLGRLLAEIETYAQDRQVILSTQSPQVVSWARPEEVRLVERSEGRTHVRGLSKAEIERLSVYLRDEGTLGEFVYAGALDE